ncbi:DoxX family protein [Brumimicrobium glaciale]|uniref:DoxX family protein n=1 Tax=Brumimicrobium glaciale TaxID=200475 RepID=A0A4Q4KEE3_9FLAO|nr:DoxX family protein [Brumimicrobium glaciale]RYM31295.1 DoxX family protein [Brumimicrobium glaciale]
MIKDNALLKDIGLLVLRVFLGLAMLFGHGLSKWTKLIEGGEIQFADPFGIGELSSMILAVFAEVFCSALLVFGLLTRLSLIPLIITMAVAVFYVHFSEGFAGFEKALLYLMGYLTLMISGPGKFAIDSLINIKFKK